MKQYDGDGRHEAVPLSDPSSALSAQRSALVFLRLLTSLTTFRIVLSVPLVAANHMLSASLFVRAPPRSRHKMAPSVASYFQTPLSSQRCPPSHPLSLCTLRFGSPFTLVLFSDTFSHLCEYAPSINGPWFCQSNPRHSLSRGKAETSLLSSSVFHDKHNVVLCSFWMLLNDLTSALLPEPQRV